MAKLNQIIAVEKGVKSKSLSELTEAHHNVQKAPLLSGISRTYQPKDEEGEQLPPESTKVQVRTEEVLRHVASTLTEKHPAQVEVYYEDIAIGYWTTLKFSGALPATRVAQLLERIEKLQNAVKFAREEANNTEALDRQVGDKVFGYLFR